MDYDYSITIGSTGRGTWNSPDGGESWMLQRKWFFPPESPIVRALTVHPLNHHTIYAGGDLGVHQSLDNGRSWDMVSSPGDIKNVWAISIDHTDPEVMYAGTSPSEVYKSTDGGRSWLNLHIPDTIEFSGVGTPRVTQIAIDPDDTRIVWAGIEVDGLRRSVDGGNSWVKINSLPEEDMHSVIITKGNPNRVLAVTNADMYVSTDMGESWEPMGLPSIMTRAKDSNYTRWIVAKPDNPDVLFMGAGNNNVGDGGNIWRSDDGGRTWVESNLPFHPNSSIYDVAVHPSDPNRVVACSIHGEVWATENLGDSWRRIKTIFGETSAVAWQPNSDLVPTTHIASGTYAAFGGGLHTQDNP